jgi:hypothetical protein
MVSSREANNKATIAVKESRTWFDDCLEFLKTGLGGDEEGDKLVRLYLDLETSMGLKVR